MMAPDAWSEASELAVTDKLAGGEVVAARRFRLSDAALLLQNDNSFLAPCGIGSSRSHEGADAMKRFMLREKKRCYIP